MTLARVLRAQAAPQVVQQTTRLRDAIVEQWRREEIGEPLGPDPWFRGSGVGSLCPRAYAIAALKKMPMGEVFNFETLWAFGIGTSYHEVFQREILRELFTERGAVFHGWWKRYEIPDTNKRTPFAPLENGEYRSSPMRVNERRGTRNQKTHTLGWGWIPKPKGKGWEYTELILRSDEYRISGHCDGVLVWPDFTELLEIKTINERGFTYIDPMSGGKPKPEHVLQVQAYMWLTGLDRCRLVYVNKSGKKFKESLAEHIVMRDETLVNELKSDLTRTSASVNRLCSGLENDEPIDELVKLVPPRLEACTKKSDYRAKYCGMKNPCFIKDLVKWKPKAA